MQRAAKRSPVTKYLRAADVPIFASANGEITPGTMPSFTSLKANATVMGESAFAPPTSLEWSNYPAAWVRGNFGTTRNSTGIYGAGSFARR